MTRKMMALAIMAGLLTSIFAVSSVAAAPRSLDATPNSLNFGRQPVIPAPVAEQTAVIKNVSSGPITITTVTATALNGAFPFNHDATTCFTAQYNEEVGTVTLQPGDTCLIVVRFEPPDSGRFTGSVTLNTNAVKVSYSGRGL
jgi:hypothetical protein